MIYYTVQGDTFDKIAKDHLQSEFRIDQLITANTHLCGIVVFKAGVRIVIPDTSEEGAELDSAPSWRREG